MKPTERLYLAEKKKLSKVLKQNLYNINSKTNLNNFILQISFSSQNLINLDDIIKNLKVSIYDPKFKQRLNLKSYFYADSCYLPIPSESTDLIILDHGYEVLDSFSEIASEIDRVLNPNGHVIFFVYNKFSFFRFYNNTIKGKYKINVVNARNEFLLKSYEYINDYKIFYFYDNFLLNIFKLFQLVPCSYMCIMQKKTPGALPLREGWKEKFKIFPQGLVEPNYEKLNGD